MKVRREDGESGVGGEDGWTCFEGKYISSSTTTSCEGPVLVRKTPGVRHALGSDPDPTSYPVPEQDPDSTTVREIRYA